MFANTYGVELLCEGLPQFSKRLLFENLKKRCPAVEPLDGSLDSDLFSFVHPDHLIEYSGSEIPAQTFIAVSDKEPDMEKLNPAIEQSWGFSGATEQIQRCTTSILVTDFLTRGLEYKTRLALFQKVLTSTLELIPCLAIHWQPTQQILEPLTYLDTVSSEIYPNLQAGALNVRLFRIINEESQGDVVMDTLGLAALGLPDLQCHFRNLDVQAVAGMLYNTGLYLFENGDVIADGHTVAGMDRNDKWVCQHEDSLVAPDRVVLDINPGYPYAAGNRR
jgi:hypothetical protein